ncbi:MAG: hydantoinase B/oxoprolinase family protein [Dehalococcoidia bacterium]|jgi:N-methylhydantoinase B/oxoprolinase/acetone carboxylase alpha subunit|nr:hydantoinase B/oxoprolinase family protein [Dehalococcoidia bacterium]HIB13570.1 hydantoinase B/oxoprolinase family protein [Dehalococcoidia bacterium]
MTKFDPVSLEIMWSRLVNITEEMWTTTLRTAVSTIIASANDFGCEVLDSQGRSVAHAYRSMPVFNMTMPNVTKEILKKYPVSSMQPGDVFLTNDPWMCAGHLPDIAVVTPVFYQGKVVAFAGNIANTSDIGGSLDAKNVRDSYEEGIFFPICKLYHQGEPNELVFDMFRWNVRAPDMVLTDLEAQVAANASGCERVVAFLEEYALPDLEDLSAAIRGRSQEAMRAAIAEMADGEYTNEVFTDGMGAPLKIAVKLKVEGDAISVDYAGSSPQIDHGGINCTMIYSLGHTLYTLACLLTPEVPVNEGCFEPIRVTAPEGSIINCTFPASVGSRVNTGWYIHGAIFQALSAVLPDRIQAGNGLMSILQTYGVEADGRVFNTHFFCGGGRGATSGGDGTGHNMFPSSASNVPIEVFELNSPVLINAKEFVQNSAGPGKFRGSSGERVSMSRLAGHPHPLHIYLHPHRLSFAAEGAFGGKPGTKTVVALNGETVSDADSPMELGYVTLDHDTDVLTVEFPSGGGMFDPLDRDQEQAAADRQNGIVS